MAKKRSSDMMAKSRKFGAGNPGKMMRDYHRPVAETAVESEGVGSSGRVDTEITVWEDSWCRKRKCMSLNGGSFDEFGVPVQVMSLSKMSRADLVLRLKREVEEVRIVLRKVGSDIHSCSSDGQKRPPLENIQRGNGTGVNKGLSFTPLLLKHCTNLVNQMSAHKFGGAFLEPVDIVKFNIPDYFNVIKHPMDFGTIKRKLSGGEYTSPQGFAADVRLTFSNAITYNPPLNVYHQQAQTLSTFFEQRWKVIEKKIPAQVQRMPPRTEVLMHNDVAMDMHHIPPSKKKKVMTDVEKRRLSAELEANLGDLPQSIIDFLKENRSGDGPVEEDEIEIEIDIDALSNDVLFKLRKLVDDFLTERKKQQIRAEPCEMELHNESGFSHSSIQPGKGNDAADEEIDIGGNDHHVTSFPPVEIEKDTANKNSRCSSPSSSTSGSGSSSSESDSHSGSSSSESEGARAVLIGDKSQATLDVKPKLDQKRNINQDVGKNQSRNSLSKVVQTPHTKPPPVEVECDKEGESAPSVRQISPDKLYRAALLRSRFADTILKAQEKALDKNEKRDPERLRLEREELERRQREEKARLQAEAKAAEEARRKAEAEAAAEVKRKREMEREAARLALQQIEKTVEINESCLFMEDFEMLGAAPADHLSNLMGDASSNDSQNGGLGSFRFRGNSNPLEQLGLYRKDYDEEEEVEAPLSAPHPPATDAEEGEID